MFHYDYKTSGTCSQLISFDLDGNIVKNVSFVGGCNGNLQGVSRLVEGSSVEDIVTKLSGIKCGFKNTSCPDQLAKAVKAGYEASKA
ncbi:MAG: TIGR03905 family TSCPD domain-containing protein [Lachnospiraceae bacterium]|nr:TIGR03905 family TSCPD domain-containing protein [Lachnospiraceae bacterium]